MTDVQGQNLNQVPRDQMLVDRNKLAAVLAQGVEDGVMPVRDLYLYLAGSILLTILAALWWATQ